MILLRIVWRTFYSQITLQHLFIYLTNARHNGGGNRDLQSGIPLLRTENTTVRPETEYASHLRSMLASCCDHHRELFFPPRPIGVVSPGLLVVVFVFVFLFLLDKRYFSTTVTNGSSSLLIFLAGILTILDILYRYYFKPYIPYFYHTYYKEFMVKVARKIRVVPSPLGMIQSFFDASLLFDCGRYRF